MGDRVETGETAIRAKLSHQMKYVQAGRFVSSVTHDVNNYLGAILAHAELVEMDSELSDESRRMLEEIRGAVQKSTDLLGSLSSMTSKKGTPLTTSNVVDVVNRVVDLLRYELKLKQTELQTTVKGEFDAFLVDESVFSRVLIYLMANGVENTEHSEVKRLDIDLQKAGEGVQLKVQNSDPPVTESEREKLFELFYTNKGDDHFGLGLNEARDIPRSHGGDVFFDTDWGFVIRWPNERDPAE